jgi:hypothetical protein
MKSPRHLVSPALALLLAACSTPPREVKVVAAPAEPPPAVPAPSELEPLLAFARDFAKASTAEKAVECKKLKSRQRGASGGDARLRLLLAQSVSTDCGEPSNYRAIADAAIANSSDERLKSFLIYHKAVQARLNREIDRRRALEKRLLQIDVREKRAHRRLQSQETELRGLQKKLEALKSIEQSLDEPND